MGFKGSRKSTPYAAQMAAEDAGKKAAEHGVRIAHIDESGEADDLSYEWTVHPPSRPVPGPRPPSASSGPASPQRLEVTA